MFTGDPEPAGVQDGQQAADPTRSRSSPGVDIAWSTYNERGRGDEQDRTRSPRAPAPDSSSSARRSSPAAATGVTWPCRTPTGMRSAAKSKFFPVPA